MNQIRDGQQAQLPVQAPQQLQQQAPQQVQQGNLQADRYIHTADAQMRANAIGNLRHEYKYKLGNVHAVVAAHMPGAYDRAHELAFNPNEDQRASVLHHSRGTALAAGPDPTDVLEFDLAGSDFQTPRADYAGLKGKNMLRVNGVDDKVKGKGKKRLEMSTVSWYNRARWLNWIPGIRTEKKILEDNELLRTLQKMRDGAIKEKFGESQSVNGTEHKHVRMKQSADGSRTRISMAGALSISGASNSGEYSIQNVRGYMESMAESYLTSRFEQFLLQPKTERDIAILVRGHSRGGVSAAEGAMMIKQWVHVHYPKFEDRVKFNLIQMDPVPGFGSRFGVNEAFDHRAAGTLEKGGDEMRPLGDSAETTVMYSLYTEHFDRLFVPQAVHGAKRVILTLTPHSVTLRDIDTGKTKRADGTEDTRAHRVAFTDMKTGEAYRGSGISELPGGVYISDEYNNLTRFDTLAEANAVIDDLLKNVGFAHREDKRLNVIKGVVADWFGNHPQPAQNAAGAPDQNG